MATSSLRPRVGDLVFHLYDRPLHPELFDILAQRKIQREDYELTVRITRTGHLVSWDNRDVHLTEVTAAADLPLPSYRARLKHRVRGEHCATLPCGPRLHYQNSFQVEALSPEIFLHVHDEIVADGEKRGLLHHFPAAHRFEVPPLGFVTADARPGCLLLSTFHTFPDEHTVVKTQSLIERKG